MTLLEPGRWYAVAADHDLVANHIYRTTLGGHDLALWRARDGTVCVWHDRCPHRGVRLSLGEVVGNELRCQYHAWRFGTGGACTFIPAQPARKVPGAIHATVWPMAQASGLIWTGIDPVGAPPALPDGAVIRAIPIDRCAQDLERAIDGAALPALALTIQPCTADRAIVRGAATDGDLVRADQALLALRRRLEAGA